MRSRLASPSRIARLVLFGFAFLGLTAPVGAQTVPPPPLDAPYLAWDRGDYPDALKAYLEILRSPEGARHLTDIALLTGERYRVHEVAPDGNGLAFAGSHLKVVVPGPSGPTVHLFDVTAVPRLVAELDTPVAELSDGGRVAFLRTAETEEVRRARQALANTDRAGRQAALRAVVVAERRASTLVVRDLSTDLDTEIDLGVHSPLRFSWAPDEETLYVTTVPEASIGGSQVLAVRNDGSGWSAFPVTAAGLGEFSEVVSVPGGRYLLTEGEAVHLVDLTAGSRRMLEGSDPVVSKDGGVVALRRADGEESSLLVYRVGAMTTGSDARPVVLSFEDPIAGPALSPDGEWVAYQRMPVHDWEIFVRPTDGSGEERPITREIQHDLRPLWLDATTILAAKGEGRHRRSFLYDVESGRTEKLFHNNTIRTIAPEYEWAASPDGRRIAIVSERDGNTVSPERGVYLVDRDDEVSTAEVIARLETNLEAEEDLRRRGAEMFAPFEAEAREVTERVSVERIYGYERDLYAFGSKFIGNPGNEQAARYLFETLESFGFEPEYQEFDARGTIRTANVLATLRGTDNPDLVYVLSSHFDSHSRGPGADDNTSGTAALLETARVLRDHPQGATIVFAFFTGEEAGLLGSREFVRQAVADGTRLVGALNNDMVGWANDHRLDNTIRYSNPGIRDVQHSAAMRFSDLITYDALYYKSTDAAAYYEEYGDIVGGIGSYPVLGNPNYHQFTDRLETINHQLVAEVAKTTAATLVLLASSPSRIENPTITGVDQGVLQLRWDAAPERNVVGYQLRIVSPDGRVREERVPGSSATVPNAEFGTRVWIRSVFEGGIPSWDWAEAVYQVGR